MAERKKTTKKVSTIETKILKEIKNTNKLLGEIRELLDNIWRERAPQ